jgi:CRP/FNR family transcriptional regulator
MSGHAHIEGAVAMTNVSLISVQRDQFGILIQKNPAVAMKIIRFFSRKLREFDQAITRLTFANAVEEDPEHLFNIGQYYLKKKNLPQQHMHCSVIYTLSDGINRDKAITHLKSINAPFKVPENPQKNSLTRVYKDNQMIFCENEPGDELYIIQGGKVKITKIVDEEVLLAVLKPGDIFGEMALLENRPRSASAITFGDTSLMAINRQNFETMVQTQPQLATRLIQLLMGLYGHLPST